VKWFAFAVGVGLIAAVVVVWALVEFWHPAIGG
jgi:hypothetical protein